MYSGLSDVVSESSYGAAQMPDVARRAASAWRAPAPASSLLRDVLDALNLGLLLVDADARVLHANQAAQSICAPGALLAMADQRLTMLPTHRHKLDAALRAAGRRQWSMLVLRDGAQCMSVGVVPMAGHGSSPDLTAMLVMDPPGQPSSLALQFFCQAHLLTAAESAVLSALCKGLKPNQIATAGGVAICTVRSQIAAIREKVAASSIGHLLQMVGALPPMASASVDRCSNSHWRWS